MKKNIFYGILIFIFSVMIGYMYSRMWNDSKEKDINNAVYESGINYNANVVDNTTVETLNIDIKVLPTTKFAIKKYFSKCGHFRFNYAELPIEIINLDKEEIKKIYPDWNIEEFSSDEVVLSKNEDSLCDEHYIIKLDNDRVKIYNKISEDISNLYMETEIVKEYLTEADIEKLEVGMLVYGRGKLNSVLEDFE